HDSSSSAASRAGTAPLEPFERADRCRAPRERRAAAVLPVVQGDQRERKLRMAPELLAHAPLDAHVQLEERALARLVVLDLRDALGDRPFGAEKELQQELVAEGLLPRRNREPARELLSALVGERVDLAIGLAALLLPPSLGQPLGGQPIQDRIDLAI